MWNFPVIFGNFPQNLSEIFRTFRNSYEFHSQNSYILGENCLKFFQKFSKYFPNISKILFKFYSYEFHSQNFYILCKNCLKFYQKFSKYFPNISKILFKFYFKFPINFIQDNLKFHKNFLKTFATFIPESFSEISTNFSENFLKNLIKISIKFYLRISQILV